MEQSQKVSVILPVYNCEKFIYKSVRSILEQSYKNLELIIIDDGSTDKSLFHLERLAKEDERVKLTSRENRGLIETLNQGIEQARGTWIGRMDADDIALPNRFERQIEWANQNQADICGSWVRRFGGTDKRIVRVPQSDEAIKIGMLFACPFVHPSILVRASLLKHMKYDPVWENAEDYELWTRAAVAGVKMTNVPEILLDYRMHEKQISSVNATQQSVYSIEIRKKYWEHIRSSKKLNENFEKLLNYEKNLNHEYDIESIDDLFAKLVKVTNGEATLCVLDHALKFYYKVASSHNGAVLKWKKLNILANKNTTFSSIILLRIIQILNIKNESKMYYFLKKINVKFSRKT